MSEHIDMKISGASTMPGGEYGTVSISGAGKVQGNLKCEELRCSGASKILGDVDCSGEIHTSGATKAAGSVHCGRLSSSGAFSAEAALQVQTLASVSGSLQTAGAVSADELRASGSLDAGSVHCRTFQSSGCCKIAGDLEAETVVLTGAATITGLLNAETVSITPNRAIEIGAIGGSRIQILRHSAGFFLHDLLPSSTQRARIDSIEGDEIDLEYVEAQIVRGRNVRIGQGCRIGCVEYTESLHADAGTVEKSMQTGKESTALSEEL